MLPVCSVPSTLPAIFFGVCVAMKAWDIGIKPVNIPIKKRNKKSPHTEVAYPINNTDKPSPVADIIRIFFLPYLSPMRPHIGEKIKAVINVTPNVQPDHVCTYELEKSPSVSI